MPAGGGLGYLSCPFLTASWSVTRSLRSSRPAAVAPVTRVLDQAGYRQALIGKLAEEAAEAAQASTEDLPGEMADVLEVLRALAAATGMSWEQLLALADDTRNRRGGFTGKIFLESVE